MKRRIFLAMLLIVALCQVSYAAIGDVFSDDVLTYKIIGVDEVEVSKPVNENCTEIAVPSSRVVHPWLQLQFPMVCQ